MSCGPGNPTFRLLDAYVGWDEDGKDGCKNLSGLDDPGGLGLALERVGEVDEGEILPYLPPPRLAPGCGPCDWFLVTPSPSRLMRLDRCTGGWLPVWNDRCDPGLLIDGVAVAAHGRLLAVADRGAGTVWIWSNEGERLSGEKRVKNPGPVAFTPWGELLVTSEGSSSILRFGPTGDERSELPARLPLEPAGKLNRLAVSSDGAVWTVWGLADGGSQLFRAGREQSEFRPASLQDLAAAFKATSLSKAAEGKGFCLQEQGPDGFLEVRCFSWHGRPVGPTAIPGAAPPTRFTRGQLLTQAIDSGMPRCRWHRVRIDAVVPPGTTLIAAVSTSEQKDPPDQGALDPQWANFPAGKPHPADWWTAPPGALDFLVNQPPGRYLFLRLRLTGDGALTPIVRRIRLDFPRSTSLEFLPPVYRENPRAEDFTERFLSLFDASIADLDRAIERYPALLDPLGVPDEVLPWLGSFLDIAFDLAWEPKRQRAVLQKAPELYRRRGTPAALGMAIKLIFGVEPVIQELVTERRWGALRRDARLGQVRVFSRSRSRFVLGSSRLSGAPLRSYGNPDHDPLAAEAFRFRLLVPPGVVKTNNQRERLLQLVESQKPAHTVAQVRIGGQGLVLGQWSAVGVDTAFVPSSPPVLGAKGSVRLRRRSVLWPGRRGLRSGIALNQKARVGIQTVAG